MTKPGYGIISECIANRTAIVYTARGRFAEYEVLVGEMPKYLRAQYLDQQSVKAGRWRAAPVSYTHLTLPTTERV